MCYSYYCYLQLTRYSEGAPGLKSMHYHDNASPKAQLELMALAESLVSYQGTFIMSAESAAEKAGKAQELASLRHLSADWTQLSKKDSTEMAKTISEILSSRLHQTICQKDVLDTMISGQGCGGML